MGRGYVTTVDGQAHYREDGAGPHTVVLLHQALRSSLEYKRVVPYLRDQARVISVDLMGYGDSDAPPRQYDIPAHAARVYDLLQQPRVEKVCLVGHHTGGNVAIEVAAQFPEVAERLVLSGPTFVTSRRRSVRGTVPPATSRLPEPIRTGRRPRPGCHRSAASSSATPGFEGPGDDQHAPYRWHRRRAGRASARSRPPVPGTVAGSPPRPAHRWCTVNEGGGGIAAAHLSAALPGVRARAPRAVP
jgi:pimeloyl-ACP methyl ester carboxylesterase